MKLRNGLPVLNSWLGRASGSRKISSGVLNAAASSQYSTMMLNAVNSHTMTEPRTRSGDRRFVPGAGFGRRGAFRIGRSPVDSVVTTASVDTSRALSELDGLAAQQPAQRHHEHRH